MRNLKKYLATLLALTMVLGLGAVSVLAAPETSVAETVLVDCDEATITVTDYDPEGDWGPTFELLMENKSDRALYMELEEVAVNGVMCSPYCGETVPAGQKVYTDLYWGAEDLQAVGINYIQTVTASVDIWDDDTYEDVYVGMTSWEMTVGETDMPAAEPVSFGDFTPVEVFTGDTAMTVVGYDPTGSMDDGPALYLYLENDTDKIVYFTADDVAVNGFGCDPYWGETLLPGTVAYDRMEWWADDLEDSHIEAVESVQFTGSAVDDDNWDEYNTGSVDIDLTGAAAPAEETAPAEEPAPAEETAPAEEPAVDGEVAELMGAVVDGSYVNDRFGLTFTPPEDWRFYSQQELLEQQGLAAEAFEGTEMGEQIESFMDSEDGFSVMMAEQEDSLQNVNVLVESLGGAGQYLTEEDLLALVVNEMGLEDGDMSAMGLEGATLTQNTFTFAGQEHAGLRIEYVDTSVGIELPMYLQMVFLMNGEHVMQVTMTTVFEDKTADVGAMFTLAE